MTIAAPLSLHRTTVKPEWVDYNNHLNDGFYLVIFSLGGVDEFMNLIGMSDAERRATKTTIYTLEAHINYLREVKLGEEVEVRAQLIGFDQKRVQHFLTMHTARLANEMAATSEFMLVNIDSAGEPKSAPFRPEVAAKLVAIMEAHKALPSPANSGRAIGLPQKKPAQE
jgi:acyl-CoA thioester hydrolase